MKERPDGINPSEWKKGEFGGLERSFRGRFGETIFERITKDLTHNHVLRVFDNGMRSSTVSTKPDGSLYSIDDFITFINGEVGSVTRVSFTIDGALEILAGEFTGSDPFSYDLLFDEALMTTQHDRKGNIRACVLQAEKATSVLESLDEKFQDIDQLTEFVRTADLKTHQQLLTITQLAGNKFSWKEIEQDNAFNPKHDKTKTVQEGNSSYGKEIHIQENKFILTRAGNTVIVHCVSARGKEIWTGKFPLKVKMDKIRDIFSKPDSDFRPLRNLISTDLEMKD